MKPERRAQNEEIKIYRNTDHSDPKGSWRWPDRQGSLPGLWHVRCDVLQLEGKVRWHQSSHRLMIVLVLILGLLNFLWGEKVPVGGGFGCVKKRRSSLCLTLVQFCSYFFCLFWSFTLRRQIFCSHHNATDRTVLPKANFVADLSQYAVLIQMVKKLLPNALN